MRYRLVEMTSIFHLRRQRYDVFARYAIPIYMDFCIRRDKLTQINADLAQKKPSARELNNKQ